MIKLISRQFTRKVVIERVLTFSEMFDEIDAYEAIAKAKASKESTEARIIAEDVAYAIDAKARFDARVKVQIPPMTDRRVKYMAPPVSNR